MVFSFLYYHVRENSTSSSVSSFPISGSFLSREVSNAISSLVSVKSNNTKFSRICSGFVFHGMIALFFLVRKQNRICRTDMELSGGSGQKPVSAWKKRKPRQSIWVRIARNMKSCKLF